MRVAGTASFDSCRAIVCVNFEPDSDVEVELMTHSELSGKLLSVSAANCVV